MAELLISIVSGLVVGLILEYVRSLRESNKGMTMSMPPMKPMKWDTPPRQSRNYAGMALSALLGAGAAAIIFILVSGLR